MGLQAQPVGPSEIRLRLITDLPEGTNRLVNAGRGYLRKDRATQPDEVLAVLGNNADHIGGAGAVLAGGFTTLSVSASVNIPFVE